MHPECPRCRGKNPSICGNKVCPILSRTSFAKSVNKKLKKDFSGQTPNVFVGRYGYPHVNIGLLSTEQYDHNDDSPFWVQKRYSIPSIVQLRTQLVNSRFKAHVKHSSRFGETVQETALSVKPVDIEVSLNKVPRLKTTFGQEVLPHGPAVELLHARVAGNVKSTPLIERVVGDVELKAKDAVGVLNKNFDEHQIVKLFSSANLGTEEKRKFVPTRWSITAVDDTIGLQLKQKVLELDDCANMVFIGQYFGNYFIVILAPGDFEFELNETFLPNSLWNAGDKVEYTTDYEGVANRTKYAHNCTGGYYAARLSLFRYFLQHKKQGRCIIIRVITPEYTVPLGVWVVREAVKKAFESNPVMTESFDASFLVAQKLIKNMFKFSLDSLQKQSYFLNKHAGRYVLHAKDGSKEGFQLALERFS